MQVSEGMGSELISTPNDSLGKENFGEGVDGMRVEYRPRVGARLVEKELEELADGGADWLVDCAPIREPSFYRGQRSKPGLYWMASMGGHVSYESKFERDFLKRADFDGDVVQVLPQPIRLRFQRNKAPFRHTPDFLLRRADATLELVDVKGAHARQKPIVRTAFTLTERACHMFGWAFTVFTEPDPVEQANIAWLSGYRSRLNQVLDVHAPALLAFAETDTFTAEQLAEGLATAEGVPFAVACAAVWRAVWKHVLHVGDLRRPLEMNTVLEPADVDCSHSPLENGAAR